MEAKDLALAHLVRPAQGGDGAAPPLLILLHGYGSNEHDLYGLAPYIAPRFTVLSVRAPLVLVPSSFAWFEIGFYSDGSIAVDVRQAEQSRALVAELVAQAPAAYGADPGRVIIAGFSQGATMAALLALTRPELVAGAAVLSGIVPTDILAALPDRAALAEKPFLVTHGLYDAVVSVEHGRASRDLLADLGVALTYREYPMAHEINLECLAELMAWLDATLPG